MTTHVQAEALVASLLETEDPKEFLRRHAPKLPGKRLVPRQRLITLDANPHDAPDCLKIVAADGRDLLVQTDWDYPGVATSFGWDISTVNQDRGCNHEGSDGTIDCDSCGTTADEFIQAARQFLDDNDGATAEDPGYFTEAEDPKHFFKRIMPEIERAKGTKRVAEYYLADIGIENCQYFQGCGTAYTKWDQVYVGTGDNPREAIDDALDSAAQDGWIVDIPGAEAEHWAETPSVSDELEARAKEEAVDQLDREDYDNDEEYKAALEEKTEEILQDSESDFYYYAAVYLREPKPGEPIVTATQEAEDPKTFLKRMRTNPPLPSTWPKFNRWRNYARWQRELQRRRAFYVATHHRIKRNPDGTVMRDAEGSASYEPYQFHRPLRKTEFWRDRERLTHWIEYYGTKILHWDAVGNLIVNEGRGNRSTRERINVFLPHGWRIQSFQGIWYWYNHDWPENVRDRLLDDQRARRKPYFPWWVEYHDDDMIKTDGTLVFGKDHAPEYKRGLAKPSGELKKETEAYMRPPPGGPLTPQRRRGHWANDPRQIWMQLEGKYFRRLARWKRIKAKHERIKEVNKLQRDLQKVDEPEKKKPKKGHQNIR